MSNSDLFTAALVGNPNCGKTTLFNALTGSNQHIGNWTGVTVEKKSGVTYNGKLELVDLPGIYSLSANSLEEKISLEYLLNSKPDIIINIIDGTNFIRNMYLTVQLLSLKIPMLLVINMIDEVHKNGFRYNTNELSAKIGIPVVTVSARNGSNFDVITETAISSIGKLPHPATIDVPLEVNNAANRIFQIISNPSYELPYEFISVKLLEGDMNFAKFLGLPNKQIMKITSISSEFQADYATDCLAILSSARYSFIKKLASEVIIKTNIAKITITEKLDLLLLNRWLAFPAFFAVMLLTFSLTFGKVGNYLSDCISYLLNDKLTPLIRFCLFSAEAPQWCTSLIIDGIISGVGGVLSFLPQIAILFICLSFLEDSGYMARAAFITDKPLSFIGLSGKSFIPMMMGFGCTTPAVMASRTQENQRERLLTILLLPFMSCGARLPVYALFASVFFTRNQSFVIFTMYLLGFFIAATAGLLLKKTIFSDTSATFVMELPPYRLPHPASVIRNAAEKVRDFTVKAGTIIFAMSIIIWLLQSFTPSLKYTADSSQSIFSIIGKLTAPIFTPLGFGFREAAVSLLAGIIAKEAVVSTMTVLYSASGKPALTQALSNAFTPLSAFSFMSFCLLYVPCISAFATIKHETGSIKWTLFSAVLQMSAAYLVSLLIYQIGSLFV